MLFLSSHILLKIFFFLTEYSIKNIIKHNLIRTKFVTCACDFVFLVLKKISLLVGSIFLILKKSPTKGGATNYDTLI